MRPNPAPEPSGTLHVTQLQAVMPAEMRIRFDHATHPSKYCFLPVQSSFPNPNQFPHNQSHNIAIRQKPFSKHHKTVSNQTEIHGTLSKNYIANTIKSKPSCLGCLAPPHVFFWKYQKKSKERRSVLRGREGL